MDRKTVLLDEAQLERQREYTRQLAALHQQRGKPVYALVDTFGCQQNVADSQHILGMLRDMGCQFTDDARSGGYRGAEHLRHPGSRRKAGLRQSGGV